MYLGSQRLTARPARRGVSAGWRGLSLAPHRAAGPRPRVNWARVKPLPISLKTLARVRKRATGDGKRPEKQNGSISTWICVVVFGLVSLSHFDYKNTAIHRS